MSRSGGPVELVYKWLVRWEGVRPEVTTALGSDADGKEEPTPDPNQALVERALRQLSKGGDAQSTLRAVPSDGNWFAVIPSPTQPRDFLPLGNPRCILNGLAMATPSVRWGRILSSLLAGLVNAGWNGWVCEKVLIRDGRLGALTELVKEVTGEAAPVFAVFLGRPGQYRKLTVQAKSPKGGVLGFLKLPLTKIANQRIRHEAAVLEGLGKFGALCGHIPKVLYLGNWQEDYVLFQSPGSGKPGPTRFGGCHRRFLQGLWDVQRAAKSGEVLVEDVYKRLQQAAPLLTGEQRHLGQAALDHAATCLAGVAVRCGWTHGDFVASNTLVESTGELFVVDWELAEFGRPTVWDIFNFHAVTAAIRREKEFPTQWGEPGLSDLQTNKGLGLLFLVDSVVSLAREGRMGRESAMEYRCEWLANLLRRGRL